MNPLTEKSGTILKLPHPIIEGNVSDFREKFNRSPFMVSHNLAGHPLFEITRLAELSNTLPSQGGSVSSREGDISVSGRPWEESAEQQKKKPAEIITNIAESDSWVVLNSVHHDPQYKVLIEQLITELESLTNEPLWKEITWLDSVIFISSLHSITPYHIDHSSNFLLQIQGEKEDNLFDQNDRSVLTEQEIERYYCGDLGGATYRENIQSKASVYLLSSGKGVHHPVLAPHWVKTGSSVSISLSINFCMRSFDLQARVYQVNHFLRKLGLKPTPPGQSPISDSIKIFALGLISNPKPVTKYSVIRSGVHRLTKLINFVRPGIK